jgi:hypothetical protein
MDKIRHEIGFQVRHISTGKYSEENPEHTDVIQDWVTRTSADSHAKV